VQQAGGADKVRCDRLVCMKLARVLAAHLVATAICGACAGRQPPASNPPQVGAPSKTPASHNAVPSAAPGTLRASDCPSGTVLIKGGTVPVTDHSLWRESTPPNAILDFCIDRTEVTVRDYKSCVAASACTVPPADAGCTFKKADELPINCVSWQQANSYCQYAHRSLPTGFEFEWARRGGKSRWSPPWGSDNPTSYACILRTSPCTVASLKPETFGTHDLTGNLMEWTSTGRLNHNGMQLYTAAGGYFASKPDELHDPVQPNPAAITRISLGMRCAWRR
jgi:formylglycine-generating enzyme required for sulfatase activity